MTESTCSLKLSAQALIGITTYKIWFFYDVIGTKIIGSNFATDVMNLIAAESQATFKPQDAVTALIAAVVSFPSF